MSGGGLCTEKTTVEEVLHDGRWQGNRTGGKREDKMPLTSAPNLTNFFHDNLFIKKSRRLKLIK